MLPNVFLLSRALSAFTYCCVTLHCVKLPTVPGRATPFHSFAWTLLWLDYPLFLFTSLRLSSNEAFPDTLSGAHLSLKKAIPIFFILPVYLFTSPTALWVLKSFILIWIDSNLHWVWHMVSAQKLSSKCVGECSHRHARARAHTCIRQKG